MNPIFLKDVDTEKAWWWWIVLVVWLTDERRLALFPAGTTVRDPRHRESPTRACRIWACAEPEFRLRWVKLCSSDNHYTTALVSNKISSGEKTINTLLVTYIMITKLSHYIMLPKTSVYIKSYDGQIKWMYFWRRWAIRKI